MYINKCHFHFLVPTRCCWRTNKHPDPWPTWVALAHSVDVGGAEDADPRSSPVLHAHAHAQEQGRHRPHQEHHAENDTGDGGSSGTHTRRDTHTQTNCEPSSQVWWEAAVSNRHATGTSSLLPWRPDRFIWCNRAVWCVHVLSVWRRDCRGVCQLAPDEIEENAHH